MRTRAFFSENFKMLPKNCALQNCILAGKEVLGRTKSAAWLSSGRGRTAGVELGCMDHCWLTLQRFTGILKINGPDSVKFLQPSYICVKEYL